MNATAASNRSPDSPVAAGLGPRDERADDNVDAETDPAYIALLQKNFSLQPSPILNNSSPAQFTMGTNFLFERATRRVCVLTNYLSRYSQEASKSFFVSVPPPPIQPVWAGVANSAKKFLQKDGTGLDIIIRCYLDTVEFPNEHEFLNTIITDRSRRGTITLRITPDYKSIALPMLDYNFVTFDGLHYRQEVNEGPITAVLQFGNRTAANYLDLSFDKMARDIDIATCPPFNRPVMSLIWKPGDINPRDGTCVAGTSPPRPWDRFVKSISAPPRKGGLQLAGGD